MHFLGIDIGTGGCKAGVFDIEGNCFAMHSRNYMIQHPGYRKMELSVRDVWESCEECIGKCVQDVGKAIDAIAVSSQGEAVFPIDHDGNALSNAILTFDGRAEAQAKWMQSHIVQEAMNSLLRPVHSMYSAAKILWLTENMQTQKDHRFTCFSDYATLMLSGEAVIDYGMASRTMLFNIRDKTWNWKMLHLCGIEIEQLSTPIPSGTIVGKILPDVADRLGLDRNTKIVTGGHDQQCCAFAVGVNGGGVAMDTLGTTESILCASDTSRYDETLQKSGIPCDAYVLDSFFAYLSFLTTSGQALDWFKKELLENRYDFDQLSSFGRNPTGILVLPHFAGSGTPWLNERDTGLIYGVNCGSSRQQLFKGIMEGTAYEARLNVELMNNCGLEVNEIRVTGGGAKSTSWLETKADIYNRPLIILTASETGALGAAMLAARGSGELSLGQMPWVHVDRVIEPDSENAKRYDQEYHKYRTLMKSIEVYRHEMQF